MSMIDIRRVLCPIDFSPASRHALEHAVVVAKWYDAPITALHAIQSAIMVPPPIFLTAASIPPGDAERQAAEKELRTWLEPAGRAGVKTDLFIDEGHPVARILDRAGSLPADLIVMGTHGVGGFDRFVLGSVTERILRKAACPVLTVPPAVHTTAKLPYTRLLCAVDFSDSSLAALRFAFSLAQESDAHLTILHVFEWPAEDEVLVTTLDVPEYRRLVEKDARGRLDALVTDDVKVWCKPVTRITHGKPYRRILELAESDRADLIVMGVRGRNPVDLALFGSTVNHVVRRATCPVLTIRG
jgi:nucleotide-binding universal stress UspA family protein